MPVDTASLLEEMRRIFSGLYAAAGTDQAFFAFESVGIPVDEAMVGLGPAEAGFSPPVALESLSHLANQAPSASGSYLTRGINTIDGTIELCLDGSQPVDAGAASALGAAKLAAQAKFDLELGSMSGVPGDQFRPVYASPPDWYDPAVGGNWTLYGTSEGQATAAPPAAPTVPTAPAAAPVWRILPAAERSALLRPAIEPAASAPAPAASVVAAATSAPAASVAARREILFEKPLARVAATEPRLAERSSTPVLYATSAEPPAVASPPAAPAPVLAARSRALAWSRAVASISVHATPLPVTTESVEVSFSQCVVTLDRPWLPDGFLMARDWYLAGYGRGELSAGTGASDAGPMPLLPRAFVAVRDLRITAAWRAEDVAAAESASSFGPFYLPGSAFDASSGTVACPGIQIIGWFCAAFPVLPPAADPSLAAASAAPDPPAPAPLPTAGATAAAGTTDPPATS